MRFRLGQKVLCISEPDGLPMSPWRDFPRFGKVYTVRAYRPDEIASLMLHEILNEIGRDGLEAGFWEDRFVEIDTKETDISDLQALLNKTPELV